MMKIIESSHINGSRPAFAQESEQLKIYDGLTTPISDDVVILSSAHKKEIELFALQALLAYGPKDGGPEQTLVQRQHAIPALISRVDCTLRDGRIEPYELEDSPSGLGIAHLLQHRSDGKGIKDRVLGHFQATIGDVPNIIISGSRRHGTDDPVIYGPDRCHYKVGHHLIPDNCKNTPVIVKTIPGFSESQLPYAELSENAVAPLLSEGDKTYGERIGLMTDIDDETGLIDQADGTLSSQVLKARIGSMAMGVSIYLSPQDRALYGKNGIVTGGRLRKDLQAFCDKDGGAYIQQFEPPIQIQNPENRNNMILRIFVLSNQVASGSIKAEVIGGCYVVRPELIVHGARNSVGGTVLLK